MAGKKSTEEDPDLLTVLSNDGLHGSHVGGVHHERDSLSLSDFHDSLEHHGVVVARRQGSYRHHLVKRRTTGSQKDTDSRQKPWIFFCLIFTTAPPK